MNLIIKLIIIAVIVIFAFWLIGLIALPSILTYLLKAAVVLWALATLFGYVSFPEFR